METDSGTGDLDRTGTEIDPAELERFWNEARRQARLETLPAYFGPDVLSSVVPPVVALSDDPAEADRIVGQVLDGTRTATSAPRAAYEEAGAPLPARGDLVIVLDGHGHPRALLATTEVRVVALDEVGESDALDEGAASLEAWRAEQDAPGEVVLERFELLHPALQSRATLRGMFGRQP